MEDEGVPEVERSQREPGPAIEEGDEGQRDALQARFGATAERLAERTAAQVPALRNSAKELSGPVSTTWQSVVPTWQAWKPVGAEKPGGAPVTATVPVT